MLDFFNISKIVPPTSCIAQQRNLKPAETRDARGAGERMPFFLKPEGEFSLVLALTIDLWPSCGHSLRNSPTHPGGNTASQCLGVGIYPRYSVSRRGASAIGANRSPYLAAVVLAPPASVSLMFRSSLCLPTAGSGVSELLDDRLENLKLELKASEKTCQALLPNVAAFTKGTREVQ